MMYVSRQNINHVDHISSGISHYNIGAADLADSRFPFIQAYLIDKLHLEEDDAEAVAHFFAQNYRLIRTEHLGLLEETEVEDAIKSCELLIIPARLLRLAWKASREPVQLPVSAAQTIPPEPEAAVARDVSPPASRPHLSELKDRQQDSSSKPEKSLKIESPDESEQVFRMGFVHSVSKFPSLFLVVCHGF
jgi:hypothetical protein